MKLFHLEKGLDLPLAGAPRQEIQDAPSTKFFALTGSDYVGMKPTLHVKEGESVKLGQILFEDKKNPGVKFTSPAAGVVREIKRGEKRAFQHILIEKTSDSEEAVTFQKFSSEELLTLDPETVKTQLVESGFWTALRTRPYSRIPGPQTLPHSLFVTAMDTNPGAPSIEKVLDGKEDDFVDGLRVLTRICGKRIYVCKSLYSCIPGAESLLERNRKPLEVPDGEGKNLIETAIFEGVHPAGLPGTHIHFIAPVGSKKTVWYIGAQDVAAIGHLFTTGNILTQRVVALSGPKVSDPVLLRTRLGACVNELVEGKLKPNPNRVISGSVLSGRTACGDVVDKAAELPGLGRYHQQISVIDEMVDAELFGWVALGARKFSLTRTVLSTILPRIPFRMKTGVLGGSRAIFPVEQFEKVMPLDIFPVFLFQALEIGDIERCEELGCLELDEEDLALCTFADPGKNDYGATLRNVLNQFMKEEFAAEHSH